MPSGAKWNPRDSGPVVRPYAVTGGRTEPADGEVLDLLAVVVASGNDAERDRDPLCRTPEHRTLTGLCQRPVTVVDIAAEMALPVGVVRVLLADLIIDGTVKVVRKRPQSQQVGNDVLKEILNGLRAL